MFYWQALLQPSTQPLKTGAWKLFLFHSVVLGSEWPELSVKLFPVLTTDGQAGCMTAKGAISCRSRGKGKKVLTIFSHSPSRPCTNRTQQEFQTWTLVSKSIFPWSTTLPHVCPNSIHSSSLSHGSKVVSTEALQPPSIFPLDKQVWKVEQRGSKISSFHHIFVPSWEFLHT